MISLKDKTALVVGGSGGLGSEICKKLAMEGCSCINVLFSNSNKFLKFKEKFNKEFPDVILKHSRVDLTRTDDLQYFIRRQLEYDLLFNCSGFFPIKNLESSNIEDYHRCFDINVLAPFLISKRVSHFMKEKGWGRIVNIGSSSSYNGSAETGLYCASKHALLGLSRSMHLELKPHGVRVYTVSPGSIQTEMGKSDERQDYSTFLNPEEVAEHIIHMIKYDNEMIADEVRLNRVEVR
jgi:NAD(P)-dependent dehydrogenase (short-subunit alcohol dehydrogenase family)